MSAAPGARAHDVVTTDGVRLHVTDLGRALVLEDCGHAATIDRPEAFNSALLDFLGEL